MSSGHTPRSIRVASRCRLPCRGCTAQRPYQSREGENLAASDDGPRSANGVPAKRASPDPSATNPNRIGCTSRSEDFFARVGNGISESFLEV